MFIPSAHSQAQTFTAITYIPKLLLTGSDVPYTSVNLIKSHPIAPNHSRQNAVKAKSDVSRPRHALYFLMTKRVDFDWNQKEVECM